MPLTILTESNNDYVVNLLLSWTYSKKLNEQQVKEIYIKLFNANEISKEIFMTVDALIARKDKIKIIFDEDYHSLYDHESNIVKINTNHIGQKFMTIEVVNPWICALSLS